MFRKSTALLCLLVGLALFYFWKKDTLPMETAPAPITLPKPPPPTAEVEIGNLIGEKLLHNYASAETTLRDDLQAISRLSLSYITLVKTTPIAP